MQEEVNEKTVALIIHSSKITAEVLKAALAKVMRDMERPIRNGLPRRNKKSLRRRNIPIKGGLRSRK